MRYRWIAILCMLLASRETNAQSFDRVATLRGGGTTDFWAFNLDTQHWEILANTPAPVGPGGAIAQLQGIGFVYAFRGDHTGDFWEYDNFENPPSNNHWISLPSAPGPVGAGGSLAGVNYGSDDQTDRLYALQGGGSSAVWKYDVATSTWSHVADVPEPVGPGGAITAPNRFFRPNGNLGFIEVLPGNGSNSVWSYNFATGSWSRLGSTPASVGPGGALSSLHSSCDFGFAGGGTTTFFAAGSLCSMPGRLADAPAPVGAGGGIAPARGLGGSDADAVYSIRGGATPDFWRYRISTNTWEALPPAPHSIGDGGGVVQTSWVGGVVIGVEETTWGKLKTLFR